MSDQDLEPARTAIKDLLSILKINRVICVDDVYEPSLPEVVIAACSLDTKSLKEIFSEFNESIPDDRDILKARIQGILSRLDPEEYIPRSKKILERTSEDSKSASILKVLFPDEMLMELSPKEWESRQKKLLEEDGENNTLFLFDQDLSKSGGAVEGGINIISSLLDKDTKAKRICGLLTHTITPENQFKKWLKLSKAYRISRDKFLVIPKRHLSEDPVYFAQLLKLVALLPNFSKLKEKTKKTIQQAARKASQCIEKINVYDLDHMVFQISHKEGLWEPDMLFRLHTLFHRQESRRLAQKTDELEEITERIRLVSHIPTKTKAKIPLNAWNIQKMELYEPGEYINHNHLPIELGDIFVRTSGSINTYYILLAQPCDLMVRNKEKGKRTPDITHVSLAEIVKLDSDKEAPTYGEIIDYFGDSPGERWYVKLKKVHQVEVCILDLCVFNQDGKAMFDVDTDVPAKIRPAWKLRHAILKKEVKKFLEPITFFSEADNDNRQLKEYKRQFRERFSSKLLERTLFQGEVSSTGKGISFNVRRVKRLSPVKSFGILMAYTGVLSRPAYDVPLIEP